MLSCGFSGRAGRTIATAYARAASACGAPAPAPYSVQCALTAVMRSTAWNEGDVQRMQSWAGNRPHTARAEPAAAVVARIWQEAQALMG